jgi:hypothetical protein
MIQKLVLLLLVCSVTQLNGQTHTEEIKKEFTFEKKSPENTLIIANINGDIKVEAYEGDKIMVTVTKSIRAKTAERLALGKTQVQLGVVDLADTIILYVDGLCSRFTNHQERWGQYVSDHRKWGYSWEKRGQGCHDNFDYGMDFTVKVPSQLHLIVSTVNDGDIIIENVKGAVHANNVNGSIKLNNLVREAEARTINGNLDVLYAQNPQRDCHFYSLNGDINAYFQKGLIARMGFESFNGSFYTNVDRLERLPVTVEKSSKKESTLYKINENRYTIGNGAGAAFLDFETFNGNVYLREK